MSAEPIDLDAAQALADAATPGPWESDGDYDRAEVCQTVEPFVTIVGTETEGRAYMSYERLVLSAADSAFIAQARTLVPALVAELREARMLLAESEERNGNLFDLGNKHLDAIDRVRELADDYAADKFAYSVTHFNADAARRIRAAIAGGAS